ncbi:MAG: MurR/RpiR family transcriptional regulator [Lachnospiraceae bacterium]
MDENRTCSEIIKLNYHSLSKSEKKVADYILATGYQVSEMALSELAAVCEVSEPSVIRFSKSIGFKGYSELKAQVLRDWGKEESTAPQIQLIDLNFTKKDTIRDVPEKIFHSTIRGLEDTMKIFDYGAFEQAVTAILNADKIDVFGVGTSGSVALDFVSRLIRIGLNARFFADNHLEQLSCVSLGEKDVAIAISHSGSTMDIINTLKIAKQSGAKTISLTNYKASIIAGYSDIQLLTGDHETTFYSETMVSRISLLAIVDMLYMGILLSDYDKFTSRLHTVNKLVETKNYK